MSANKDLQLKQLKLALTHLEKQYGKGTIVALDESNLGPWPSISTGVLSLDMALGIGGLPKGRIVEIFGHEGIGKSTLCCSIIHQAQKAGGNALFIDVEHALDPIYAKNIGVDLSPDRFFFAQPGSGEEAFQIADEIIRTGTIDVVVIDSVASLIPKAELEGSMEDKQMAELPRLMGKGLRKLDKAAAENNTLLVFTNQVRKNLGVYGSPDITPGGKALPFASSVRIKLKKKEGAEKEVKNAEGEIIGIGIEAHMVKNKMSSPFKKATFDIIFGKGVDNLGCIVDLSVDKGLLVKSGGWYKWPETDTVFSQGRFNAISNLANDLDLADKLKDQILNEEL